MKIARTKPLPVVLVDDEGMLMVYTMLLKGHGIGPVMSFDDGAQLLPFLRRNEAAAVVLDLSLPTVSGKELLERVVEEFPQLPVLISTGIAEVGQAVSYMRAGACDARSTAARKTRLALLQRTKAVSRSGQPVLVTGETGVGKEIFAEAVHRYGGSQGKFVTVNVAGLDDAVFSDTLFGHRKGAFTGAEQNPDGLIKRASGGTSFWTRSASCGRFPRSSCSG